ncbi:universal stress protein [Paraburkholderia sp. CNPSo 3157]|uniref:Universal stress protein n=1 Tax=Paraburkholderia franconis TaxID=2654983 RepID=A0A7X1NAC1_9BURK|nr:universal stress protein [Paraburkholderia franconis]MPW18318.1 universal stress protein [Paraburkholderia franconis]
MTDPVASNPMPGRAFQRVLVAVDGTEASVRAAEYVNALFAGEAQIALVSVVQSPHTLFPLGATARNVLAAARDELLQDARTALHEIEAMFSGTQPETELVELSKHNGDTVQALLDVAARWRADLVVMGARHHHGLSRWVEGTVSEPVTQRTGCSLLLVPENSRVPTNRRPERIVFALDGSVHSLVALRMGLQFAAANTELRAVYVLDRAVHLFDFAPVDMLENAFLEEGQTVLELAARIFAEHQWSANTALIETNRANDDVPHAIVRDAQRWNADLLVVGTHGRRGLARWFMGSVAARTLRLADTPVLLARAPEVEQAP